MSRVEPEWLERYGHRIEALHLPHKPAERQAEASVIGRDGSSLLTDLFAPDAPLLLREIPAVEILRRVWIQNYWWEEGQIRRLRNEDLPPATMFINSPSDHQARYGKKRETRWTGYKLPLTETCDEDRPHLLTHVATTSAPTTDEVMTEPIQQDLETSRTGPRATLARFGLYYCSHPRLEPAAWN